MDAKSSSPTRRLPKEQRGDVAKKTYFGITALITGVVSVLFLGANYTVANLDITPRTFSQLNNLTALFFCIFTPLTFVLGVLGHTRKNDSKALSWIAIVLAVAPFLIKFAQLVNYLIK
jgi:hypothetical protein